LASIPYSAGSQFKGLSVTIDDAVAAVVEIDDTVYDSSVNVVGRGAGGVHLRGGMS
jgi:hypothetical protein